MTRLIKDFDAIFYIYILLALFMAIMVFLILKKSRSTFNFLFSLTPLLFFIVLILNLVEYWIDIPNIIPRIPYLLASMGVYYAGIYIFEGKVMRTNRRVILFSFLFSLFALVLSIYIHLLDENSIANPIETGLMHMSIGIPILFSLKNYYNVKELIPSQARSINFLLLGSLFVILGAVIRGLNFILTQSNADSIPGLVIIMLGAIIIISSFTSITGKTDEAIS